MPAPPASDLPASDLPASDLPASDLPASDLSATLPLSGHLTGAIAAGCLTLSAHAGHAALPDHPVLLLPLMALSATIGLPAALLYGLTLWRMIRQRPLTFSIRAEETCLLLQISSGPRPLRQVRYPFAAISDCGLTPVDSGFSSLWRPYLGLGDPVRRTTLPLGCHTDLRRLPPERFGALLDQIIAVLAVHQPQALLRLRQHGPAYG